MRHIGSVKLFGKSSDVLAVKLISAPAKKKMLSVLMPSGRFRDSDNILGNNARACFSILNLSRFQFLRAEERLNLLD